MAKDNRTAVESVFLSREGYAEINKICKYLSSLIVKNEAEANEYETEYSYTNYTKYQASYLDSKSIYTYTYTNAELEQFFSKDVILNKNLKSPDEINKMIITGNTAAINFINYLQKKYIRNYIEYNQYYRQFMGMPMDIEDRVAVLDLDSGKPNDYVAIHEVTQTQYPKTYEYYFIKRNIVNLISEYNDLDYLKFLENPITPYVLRKSPDFTIFYSDDGLLDEDELVRFKRAYNKARVYVYEQLYVVGMSKRFPIYGNLVYLLILFYTVNNYFNLKLEDYSLRKYTKYDIYDILESNGLKNLTKISDLSLLKKIIMEMDNLNQYKGTEYILNILFRILDDNSITVKRLMLVKDYRQSNTGNLEFDVNKLYQSSVGLKFNEEPIAIDSNNTIEISNSTKYIDYDDRTQSDDMWGGVDQYTSSELKSRLKKEVKRDILKQDFNKLKTKYISISKSINIIEKSLDNINILYLVLKYYYDYEINLGYNPFKQEDVVLAGIECKVIDLLAAFCYLNNTINGLDEPWKISLDRNFLSSCYLMRTTEGLYGMLQDIKDTEIDIGNPVLNKKIGEIIEDDNELLQYLTKYNLTASSTLSDVLDNYDKSKEVFELLNNKLENTHNTLLYNTFKKLYEYNKGLFDFTALFDGETDYREFIRKKNVGLIEYLESIIVPYLEGREDKDTLVEPLNNVTTRIEDFINTLLNGKKYFSFNNTKEDTEYLSDLKILMNEYLSIFSELYSVEKVVEIDDTPNNFLKFTYFQESTKYITTFYEKLVYRYRLVNRLFKDNYFDSLSFFEKVQLIAKNNFLDYLVFTYNVIHSKSISHQFDLINFFYKLLNIKVKENYNDSIKLKYQLIDFKHKD